MRKFLLSFVWLFCTLLWLPAQTTVTYPDDFVNGWDAYIGKKVTFTNRFYLGGFNTETREDGKDYYTDIALLTQMRRTPTDIAAPGTPEYTEAEASSNSLWNNQVRLFFNNGYYYLQRIGSYVENLTATVENTGILRVEHVDDVSWKPGRPTQRPELGNAEIVVCGANLEAFSPFIDEFKSDGAPQTQEEADLKTAKVIAALRSMDADIYAFCELQDNPTVVNFIAEQLNEAYATPGLYAGLNDGLASNQIGAGRTGFVYRTTTVKPVGEMGFPDPSNYVYSRHQYVQHFEQLSNGGRFALSVNHFKAKTANSDPERVRNMTCLINYLNGAPSLDEDVLVMGDLNTYGKEEPIVMIEREGYENLLTQYNPEGFSYIYNNETGNMDHALASASLTTQVTGAAVYQLNAEESWNYKMGGALVSSDMYGYSDHNPVLVGLRLNPEPEKECENINYSETFSSSLGAFTTKNILGTKDWYCNRNGYANMNGYSGGNNPNEDWLISPVFDLSGKGDATLSFEHTIGYCADKEVMRRNHTLHVTDHYTGDPNTTTWTQLDIPVMPAGTNAVYVKPTIQFPKEMLKENVQFAFKYLSDDKICGNWCIKNLTFKATCTGSSVNEVKEESGLRWFTANHIIYMYALPVGATVALYDVLGKCIGTHTADGTHIELTVPTNGIYIVTVAGKAYKVAVAQ